MKILLRHTSIDYSHYDAAVLHETFGIISLRVKADIDERCLQLPILFENACDTREFYTQYHNALYNNDPQYEFKGEAWFSLELYIRLRDGLKNY